MICIEQVCQPNFCRRTMRVVRLPICREPRTVYLYAKCGRQADILQYINEALSHAMVAWPAETALETGLFGPVPHASQTVERVGDVIVALRQGYVLLTSPEREKADKMLARHGGMTEAEMRVPWLGLRLD